MLEPMATKGDIYVRDGNGRTCNALLIANTLPLYLGSSGNEGDLRVKDGTGTDSVSIDGNTGTITARRVNASALNATSHVRLYRISFWAYAWNTSATQYHYRWLNHANRQNYNVFTWYEYEDISYGESGTQTGKVTLNTITEQNNRTRVRLSVKNVGVSVRFNALCVRK